MDYNQLKCSASFSDKGVCGVCKGVAYRWLDLVALQYSADPKVLFPSRI
jgi:hypothetical protein